MINCIITSVQTIFGVNSSGVLKNAFNSINITKHYQQLDIKHGQWQSKCCHFSGSKKAFDTVSHDIIIQKLHCYGITGDELKFFRSYLSNRKQCCSVNGRVSDYEDIACGVPQGSILGPLLFIIYVNDFPNFVKDSNISMYADDTGLSSKISNALEINSELLPDFLKVCDWLKANKFSLNIVKTEYMIIGTSQKLMQLGTIPKIKVNNTLLKRVPHTKSLDSLLMKHCRGLIILSIYQLKLNEALEF